MNEKVSVLIPCYNSEKYVEQAIRSIMKQTYDNLEIIIIDDCSTDGSWLILQQLAAEDSRINLRKHTCNRGIVFTLNEMIQLANGSFICRMDADDISLPERIQEQVRFLQENPDITICGTFAFDISESGKRLYPGRLPGNYNQHKLFLPFFCTLYHPSVMAKADFFKNEPYSSQYIHCEDYELWCRAVYARNLKIYNIPKYLVLYRKSATSISAKNTETQWENTIRVLQDHQVVSDKYLQVHSDIFFLRNGKSDINLVRKYIKSVLRTIANGETAAKVVVIEKIMLYLLRQNYYRDFARLTFTPMGIRVLANNRMRKIREFLNH